MDIEIQSDASRGFQLVDLRPQAQVFGRVAGFLALVRLVTRIGRGAATCGPLVGPIAVDVSTNAAVAADGLAILPPETVGCLGVDKTIGIDDGRDVEVEFVY